jgi:hypothetical protein
MQADSVREIAMVNASGQRVWRRSFIKVVVGGINLRRQFTASLKVVGS